MRVRAAATAPDPDSALKRLARQLFEYELHSVVRSFGQWTDLREAVVTIARERPLPGYVPVLWRSWQAFPSLEKLAELLSETVARFGVEGTVVVRYEADVLAWLREHQPVDAIVHWTAHNGIPWNELPSIPDSPFEGDTPLITRIFHRTLQIGSGAQLLGMNEATLLGGWAQMSGESHMKAGANFLRGVTPAHWPRRHGAMEELRDSYGTPSKPGVTLSAAQARRSISEFWERVSVECREEFRQYFIGADLAFAFKGDATPERQEFWLDQRRGIVSVGHGTARDTPFCVIAFPGFVVVEFFALGNAAYLYPKDHSMERYWSRPEARARAWHPSELKWRTHEFPPPGDNRIIHQGGWQHRAQRTLLNWQDHYP